ncbi:MAG: T9SS type A sorting domain-containing protein, partial [Flammeovirgaceae bacterium]
QSFWVTAAGTGNLTVTESMKSSSGTYVGRVAQETPKDYVRISLLSGNMKDESVILFREGAKETFNVINDAKKRLSGDPVDGTELRTYVNVGTLKPGTPEPLVFNFSPLLTPIANKNVKLYVQVASAGAHSLKFTDLETFTLGYQFTLIDKFLNKEVEVKNGTEYAFTTTDVAASYALDRFELSIAREEVQTAANDEADKWVAYPNPSQGSFAIHVPSSVTTDQIKIVDSKGNAVSSVVTKSENTVSIDLSNQPSGLYIIRVQDGSLNRRVKIIKK